MRFSLQAERVATLLQALAAHCRPVAAWQVLWTATALATLMCGAPARLLAQIPEVKFNLLETVSAQTAMQAWQQSASFSWDQQPLREGLAKLSQTYQISIWCDRRIDPTQRISFTPPAGAAGDSGLLRRFEQLAVEIPAEVGIIENVVYLGPQGEVQQIQLAAQLLHDAIRQQDVSLGDAARTLDWSELTSPQELLERLEQTWGINIEGRLPHDLLHAGQLLSPTTLATQLTLITSGFGMSATLVGDRRFQLTPIQAESRWKATYARGSVDPAGFAKLRTLYPGSQLQARAKTCTLVGVTNFHVAMLSPPALGRRGNASARVWSFEVADAPTAAIMDKLAVSLGVQLVWDPACTPDQQARRQSLDIKQVTTDSLLKQVCEGADLQYTLRENVLTLRPKPD